MLADDLQHLAVVFAAVGHRRVGRVRHLQRELAQLGVGRLQLLLLRGELSFSAAAASIFAGRSSGAALPISLLAAFCRARKAVDLGHERAARLVGREHLVDQAVAHALAFDAARGTRARRAAA